MGCPAAIAEIRDYRFGPDAGINEGNFDFVVVADFESDDDYVVYRDHPVHRASSPSASPRTSPSAPPCSTSSRCRPGHGHPITSDGPNR